MGSLWVPLAPYGPYGICGSLWVPVGAMGFVVPPHSYECCSEAAAWLGSRFGGVTPRVGLVCGSGLGALAEDLGQPHSVEYSEIPHFPHSTGQCHTMGGGDPIRGDGGGSNPYMGVGPIYGVWGGSTL